MAVKASEGVAELHGHGPIGAAQEHNSFAHDLPGQKEQTRKTAPGPWRSEHEAQLATE